MVTYLVLLRMLELVDKEVNKTCKVYLEFNPVEKLPLFYYGAVNHYNLINPN